MKMRELIKKGLNVKIGLICQLFYKNRSPRVVVLNLL